jgi:hypothetical protein
VYEYLVLLRTHLNMPNSGMDGRGGGGDDDDDDDDVKLMHMLNLYYPAFKSQCSLQLLELFSF